MIGQRTHLLMAARPGSGRVSQSALPGFDTVSQYHMSRSLYDSHVCISGKRATRKQSVEPSLSQFKYLTGTSAHWPLSSAARDRVIAPNRKHTAPTSAAFVMGTSVAPMGHRAQRDGRSVGVLTERVASAGDGEAPRG